MTIDLRALVEQHRDDLIERMERGLGNASHPHYQQLGPERVRLRSAQLVDAFREALAEDPNAFVRHVESMAKTRASEGFRLDELQDALSVMEEATWDIVVGEVPLPDQVPCLGRVTTTVGRAKDALARIFLAHKWRAESELSRLQAHLSDLLEGTVSTELREDD